MHIYIIYYTSELTTISPFFIASKTSLTFSTVELLKFGFSDGIPMPSFLASNVIVCPPGKVPFNSAYIIW